MKNGKSGQQDRGDWQYIQDHPELKAAIKAAGLNPRDVDIIVDDPSKRFEDVWATKGEHDIFVFDASTRRLNDTEIHGFKPGEDYVFFTGMQGQDLYVGGDQFGRHPHTTLTPAGQGHTPPNIVVDLIGQPYNFDLNNNNSILPHNSYDIHYNGTIFA